MKFHENHKKHNKADIGRIVSGSKTWTNIATHQVKKAGITLIQRFGSVLNLNVHFHMLLLDGVYTMNRNGKQRFHYVLENMRGSESEWRSICIEQGSH